MKKIILTIATIAFAFLGTTTVLSSEKEPVTISFPDGHQVTGFVDECELDAYECTIALTDGSVYTVMYTQVDDVAKIVFDKEWLDYIEHIYPRVWEVTRWHNKSLIYRFGHK